MQSTDWAEEHSKALREFLQSGMSYSRIADAINAKFKTAYSRNATIGRAKRMGLPGPDRPRNWPKPTLSAEALRLHRLRERLASESSRPMPALESVEPVNLRCVEIIHAVFHCWISRTRAIAVILTAATRRARPSPFAVTRGARARAIVPR